MKISRITHEEPGSFWACLKSLQISRLFNKPSTEQLVDEVVISDANIHLERMDNGTSIIIISDTASDKCVRICLWAAGRDDLRVRAEVENERA